MKVDLRKILMRSLLGISILMLMPAKVVLAGDLNEVEKSLLAIAAEVHEKDGTYWKLKTAFYNQGLEKLLEDDIDVTEEQAMEGLSIFYEYVGNTDYFDIVIQEEEEPKKKKPKKPAADETSSGDAASSEEISQGNGETQQSSEEASQSSEEGTQTSEEASSESQPSSAENTQTPKEYVKHSDPESLFVIATQETPLSAAIDASESDETDEAESMTESEESKEDQEGLLLAATTPSSPQTPQAPQTPKDYSDAAPVQQGVKMEFVAVTIVVVAVILFVGIVLVHRSRSKTFKAR